MTRLILPMIFFKKLLLTVLCLFLCTAFCTGEEPDLTTLTTAPEEIESPEINAGEENKTNVFGEGIFSLNWAFMMNAILSYCRNDFKGPEGYPAYVFIPGLGISYEKQFFTKFSLKGSFDFATYIEKDDNDEKFWLSSIGLSLASYYYPFAKQNLSKLYLGGGIATNFLMLDGNSISKEDSNHTAISVFPAVGWKQQFGEWASVDLFCAWRFIISNDSIPSFADNAYTKGFDYGIKCSLNLGKIAKKIFRKKAKNNSDLL